MTQKVLPPPRQDKQTPCTLRTLRWATMKEPQADLGRQQVPDTSEGVLRSGAKRRSSLHDESSGIGCGRRSGSNRWEKVKAGYTTFDEVLRVITVTEK